MIYDFPQYRKLQNERSYYFIESADRMHELQRLGNAWIEYSLTARILPEKLLIQDMLEGLSGTYLPITKEEFEERKMMLHKK